MTQTLSTDLVVFMLSPLVGFEVMGKLPSTLHTPMMSGANVVGGHVLTDRMLQMFRRPAPTPGGTA